MATTRTLVTELERQIGFQKTVKQRHLDKYLAAAEAIDTKIADLEVALAKAAEEAK